MARSTFYYGAATYGKDDKYAAVIKLISEIYHLHKGRYGYRRIRLELKRKGYNLN
ncbi:HTH-like domain protein, partial [Bacteroides fragilis str. S23L24]